MKPSTSLLCAQLEAERKAHAEALLSAERRAASLEV